MDCFCAALKKAKEALGKDAEEECDHSFCTVQRQKKQCGCVDLPPKGLPWSSGLLKYIPGQRNVYKQLVLDKQAEQEQQPQQPPCAVNLCKPKEEKKCDNDTPRVCPCSDKSIKKKKKKKKSRSKRSSIKSESSAARRSIVQQPPQQQGAANCCCIELEEVYVCDGVGAEPRKGYLVKTCQRPEASQALAAAEEEIERLAEENEAAADQGVICLCIPRSFLLKKKGQEDICGKYGVPDECPEEDGGQ